MPPTSAGATPAPERIAASPELTHHLTVRSRGSLGRLIPVRVQVEDMNRLPIGPSDPSIPFYRAYTGHNYFYSSGTAELDVSEGPIRILLSHGPEWEAIDDTVTVTADTAIDYSLHALFPMRLYNWFSGDTHIHVAHGGDGDAFTITPTDVARAANAEDLALTCALSNGLYFTGSVDPVSDVSHLVYFGMEYRSALYGHMAILGLDELLPAGCCLPGDPPYPTNYAVSASAHAQHATVILAHPVPMDPSFYTVSALDWPYSGFGREFPVDLALGGLDAIDIYSYSNASNAQARQVWYDGLNLGYHLPLSAGTDASMNRWYDPPIGGYRVYVHVPWGTSLSLESWLAALRSGYSFATNGPLVLGATLGGQNPGSTLTLGEGEPHTLSGFLTLRSREPLDHIDVVHNGQTLQRVLVTGSGPEYQIAYSVNVPAVDGWVALLIRGTRAHPTTVGSVPEAVVGPVYLRAGATSGSLFASRDTYLEWIDLLRGMVLERSGVGDPDEITTVLHTLDRGRRKILGRSNPGEDDRPDVAEPDAAGLRLAVRGPAVGHTFSMTAPDAGGARLEVFDVQGRLVHDGSVEPGNGEITWNGSGLLGRAPAGIYFARLRRTDAVGQTVRLVLLN